MEEAWPPECTAQAKSQKQESPWRDHGLYGVWGSGLVDGQSDGIKQEEREAAEPWEQPRRAR